MAITCPRCGAGFDVTLFQFGHRVRCDCGAWVEFGPAGAVPGGGCDPGRGHVRHLPSKAQEDRPMAEVELGKVTHYFSKIGVAAIEITQGSVRVGDTIRIHGHTSDFKQKIDSMQVDNKPVEQAEAGESIGLKVVDHARQHDMVYKVVE